MFYVQMIIPVLLKYELTNFLCVTFSYSSVHVKSLHSFRLALISMIFGGPFLISFLLHLIILPVPFSDRVPRNAEEISGASDHSTVI